MIIKFKIIKLNAYDANGNNYSCVYYDYANILQILRPEIHKLVA